jgi:hypothetical protein
MPIIGKILEGNHTFLSMKKNNVLNGKLKISYKPTLMDVRMNIDANTDIDANTAMDGKNKNTTLLTIKCMHADK